ncbi:hypothetical protein [Streptomyces flavofungini]|uniref:Tripartite tricarboxylate transporter TctB family protein n=1 Tax=Streptomyces flavofungini TaxID=68200 RepID=A0ABS0X901_9ACTN|nr:hypothetical protein [Streptomyces flavofungini]MBJ3809683.1 hypothetical protein [Streptomyces flavofungini]GHC80066.1 hypothetical protein GCM10010349_62290 [Streptomyces flavofungini]
MTPRGRRGGLVVATAGLLAARGVYGCIVVLSILLALEDYPPPAFETALLLAATLTGIVAAEAFASLIGQEVERGRPPTRAEWRRTVAERSAAFTAVVAPLLFFVLAGFGLFAERLAFTLSRWVTLILLFVFCCAARGLSGRSRTNALLTGTAAAAVGVVLANFKSLTHG